MHPLWATVVEKFLILPSPSSLFSRLVYLAVPCARAIPHIRLALTPPQNLCSSNIIFWSRQDQNHV